MKRAKTPDQLVPKPNETWTLLKGWEAATKNVEVRKSGNEFFVSFTDSTGFGGVSFDTKTRESFRLDGLFVDVEWSIDDQGDPHKQPSLHVSYNIGGYSSATREHTFASPERFVWNFEFNIGEAGDVSSISFKDAKLTLRFARVNQNDSFVVKNVWSIHKFRLPPKFVRLVEPRVVDEHRKIIGSTIDNFIVCESAGKLIKATDEYLVKVAERTDFLLPGKHRLCDQLTKNLASLLANHYIRRQSTWELLVHIAACTRANERVPLFIVGGAIRDLCTGKSPENVNDIDCAVACSYDELVRSIKDFFVKRQADLGGALHCDGKFKENGMIKIDHGEADSDSLDIGIFKIGRASIYPITATLQADRGQNCGNNWVYGYSMVDDAMTRDFTMNAIYVDPLMWKVYDPLDQFGRTFYDDGTARAIFCNEKDLLSLDGDLGGRFRFWKLLLQPDRFLLQSRDIESVDKRMVEDIERLERNDAADKGWARKWVGKFTQKLGKGDTLKLLNEELRLREVTFFRRLKTFAGKVWKNHLIFKELQESVAGEKAIKDLFARISKLP